VGKRLYHLVVLTGAESLKLLLCQAAFLSMLNRSYYANPDSPVRACEVLVDISMHGGRWMKWIEAR
jgi:hypothetical protein